MTKMKGVSTEDLMQIAIDLAGQTRWPADSKIHVHGDNIKKILFGIDIGVAEILMGRELGVDCVMAHHPDPSVLTFPDVLDLHVDIMVRNGVPEDEAWEAVNTLKEASAFARHSANYDHAPSFARLLGMPFLNIHNPLDEIGRQLMQKAVDDYVNPDSSVSDVVAALKTVPEIGSAPTDVVVRLGDLRNRAGKTVVVHGAGTNGGATLARLYFKHGVDTVVYIHIAPSEMPRLRQEFPHGKNLVISGHIASDVAGINPYIKKLEDMGLEIIKVSGLAPRP
jgi:hypothetical protein